MILMLQVTSKEIRILKFPSNSNFTPDNALHDETFSTLTKPKSTSKSESTSAIDVQTNFKPSIRCSQVKPFDDTSFFKYKTYFQGFSTK